MAPRIKRTFERYGEGALTTGSPLRTERVPIARLHPAPWNPRILRDARFKSLCASLQADPEFLDLRPILATADGTVYGGNQRLRAAMQLGWAEVPAIIADIPERLARERALKDNNNWGEWQEDDLAALVYDLGQQGADLAQLGFDDKELTRLLDSVGALGEGDDVVPEPPAEPITRPGDLWLLGPHKVACVDSLDRDAVKALLGADTPQMIFADPPYGIDIVDVNGFVGGGAAYDIPFGGVKNRRLGAAHGSKPFGSKDVRGSVGASNMIRVGLYAPVIGDDSPDTALAAYALCADLFPAAVHVWWGGNHYAGGLPSSPCWIVWDKENTGNFADAELAWTNQKSAVRLFRHMWNGLMKESERGEKRVHPTQKPVALAEWCFKTYGKDGDLIFDPFLGSGITIIAAHNTGRRVVGCELSPEYCDVIVQRWEHLTGDTARREASA